VLIHGLLEPVEVQLLNARARFKTPIYRLLGGFREKVPAYASTMCGDDIPGGLDTPEAYADFAEKCKQQGYKAFKLHTSMSPLFLPDPKRDIAACRSVRERVGDDMVLVLDCNHSYSREEARALSCLAFLVMRFSLN